MKKVLRLSTFEIGTPRKRGQGLRVGATRWPPHGVPKSRWTRDGYFDLWFPALAPSLRLLGRFKSRDWNDAAVRKSFFDSYERELLSASVGRQAVEFVARVAERTPVSIGCYCGNEARCHRSRLFKIIKRYA
jgi:uncharacterized protein YeaO (DUF488 family)